MRAIDATAYNFKVQNDATIAEVLATTDAVGAFAAGWVSEYFESMRMAEHSTTKAKSIKWLAESHAEEWARGSAQGMSAATAYRQEGSTYAMVHDVTFANTGRAMQQ